MWGAFFGRVQWLVLRGRVRQAGWWVLASAASSAIGWVIGGTMANEARFFGIISAVLSGIIGGIVLAWLTQHPIQQPADLEQNITT